MADNSWKQLSRRQTWKKRTPWTQISIFLMIFWQVCQIFCLIWNVQIRNNFKNIIFEACKWCKICKYYVNSMAISCSTCQKKEKEWTLVKYLLLRCFVVISNLSQFTQFFSAKFCIPKVSEFTKKKSSSLVEVERKGGWGPC